VCSPGVSQRPLASLRASFPDFDTVVGRGCENASTIEIDMEDSDSVMVARLKVVNCRHFLQHMHGRDAIDTGKEG
jgi:hypothetical protein